MLIFKIMNTIPRNKNSINPITTYRNKDAESKDKAIVENV